MAGKSNIEWTGHTWNPIAGCSVLSAGCTNCYAMKTAARLGIMGQPLYKGLTHTINGRHVWTGEMRKAARHVLLNPLRRKKPTTYFVNSMSDLFHENVPDAWIDEIFAVMSLCPQHTFQVLTKRAGRMRQYCTKASLQAINGQIWSLLGTPEGSKIRHGGNWRVTWPVPNVWLGVSVEKPIIGMGRTWELANTPAAVRFWSCEPLLEDLGDLTRLCLRDTATDGKRAVDWVIVGGESGNGAREMQEAWAESIRDQCRDAGVAFFMKQMTKKAPIPPHLFVREYPKAAA